MRAGRRQPSTDDFGPELQVFKDGLLELRRDGVRAGHVATHLGWFRGLWGTIIGSTTAQPCVWMVVVWPDGRKERLGEDYPPLDLRSRDLGRSNRSR